MAQKPPYVLDAASPDSGRPATFIFLHGYADDAEGLPLGMIAMALSSLEHVSDSGCQT
jgi:hypothetical protein